MAQAERGATCGFWGAAHPSCLTGEIWEALGSRQDPRILTLEGHLPFPLSPWKALRAQQSEEMVTLGLRRSGSGLESPGTWLRRSSSWSQRRSWSLGKSRSGLSVFQEAPQKDSAHCKSHCPATRLALCSPPSLLAR